MKSTKLDKIGSQQGFALILVLWVVALLTIMAASFAQSMRRETILTSNIRDNAQAQAYAQAGMVFTQLMLSHKDKELRWRADGNLYPIAYENAKIRVKIFAETGKIDINKANEQTLNSVFAQVVGDQEQLDSLVGAILDWRDKDDEINLNGAEKDEYFDQGLDYQPSNKPFQNLEELQLVLGMNNQIYQTVESLLTIYSGKKNIDTSTATREVLMTIPDVTAEMVDAFLLERVESAQESLPAPTFPIKIGANNSSGNVYTVITEALLTTGVKGRLRVVLKATNKPEMPFHVLEWEQRFVSKESFFQEQMDQLLVN